MPRRRLDLRPGLLDIGIRSDGKYVPRDLIVLQPGQFLDLGDVPIAAKRAIEGRCEGLSGEVENARIAWTRLDPTSHPALRRHTDSTRIAADGSFKLNLHEGRYRLRAFGAGGCVTEVDTRTLGDTPLVLQLAPEAPLRLDVETGGDPPQLTLFDDRGRKIYERQLRDGWKFALQFLLGEYRAELTNRRGTTTRAIHLGTDGADLQVR